MTTMRGALAVQQTGSPTSSKASPPGWLETWGPGDSIPASATKGELRALHRALTADLEPPPAETIARSVADLILSIEALGIRIGADMDEQGRRLAKRKLAELYTEAVRALPADLVPVACRRVLQTKLGARPPTPAQVTATVAEEKHRRLRLAAMAFLAAREAPDRPRQAVTEADRQANLRLVSEAVRRATERTVENPDTAAERMERFVDG